MKSTRAPLAAINITPLVDVLLILVAILLLVAPQIAKRLPVDVPRSSFAAAPHIQQSLLVTLDNRGALFVDELPVSARDVIARVQAGLTTVEIAASGAVPYSAITSLIDTLRTAHPREIVLLTR